MGPETREINADPPVNFNGGVATNGEALWELQKQVQVLQMEVAELQRITIGMRRLGPQPRDPEVDKEMTDRFVEACLAAKESKTH